MKIFPHANCTTTVIKDKEALMSAQAVILITESLQVVGCVTVYKTY